MSFEDECEFFCNNQKWIDYLDHDFFIRLQYRYAGQIYTK